MGIEQTHTVNQMETPHSSVGAFQLPCGYLDPDTRELYREVKVREISGHEEDMMSSKKTPNAQKLNNLLLACVVQIGPIEGAKLSRVLKALPIGDRIFLLFAIRRVTLGDELPVTETCPSCGTKSLFMVDLGEELVVKEMPSPMKWVYDDVLPRSQMAVRFRVSTGADEATVVKLNNGKRSDARSQAIMMRLDLLGEEPPTLKGVQGLSLVDRNYLRDRFNEVEGGVDTSIDFECSECGHEWQKDLDIGARDFFFPSGMSSR